MAQSALLCPDRSERESRYHSTFRKNGPRRASAPIANLAVPEGSSSGLPVVTRVTCRGLSTVQERGGLPGPGSHSI